MNTTTMHKLKTLHEKAEGFPMIQKEIEKEWCANAIPYFMYDHNLNTDVEFLRNKIEVFNENMAKEVHALVTQYAPYARQATVSRLLSYKETKVNAKGDKLKIPYCTEKNPWQAEVTLRYAQVNALCTLLSCTRQELETNTVPGYTYKVFLNGNIEIHGDIQSLLAKWPVLTWEEIHKKARETEQSLRKTLNLPESA